MVLESSRNAHFFRDIARRTYRSIFRNSPSASSIDPSAYRFSKNSRSSALAFVWTARARTNAASAALAAMTAIVERSSRSAISAGEKRSPALSALALFDANPCLMALRAARDFPPGLRGPVLFAAFLRFAAICRSEAPRFGQGKRAFINFPVACPVAYFSTKDPCGTLARKVVPPSKKNVITGARVIASSSFTKYFRPGMSLSLAVHRRPPANIWHIGQNGVADNRRKGLCQHLAVERRCERCAKG